MKVTTVLLLAMTAIAGNEAMAQNGAGSGPPQQNAPPKLLTVPTPPKLPPIRLTDTSTHTSGLAIIDNRQHFSADTAIRERRKKWV